jgi:hypothetical protein
VSDPILAPSESTHLESEEFMRRSWLRLCVGLSVVGAVLVMGCGHSRHHCNSCDSAKGISHPIAVASADGLQPVPSGSNYAAVPQPPVVDTKIVEVPKPPEPADDTVEQARLTDVVLPEPVEKVHRRSYADISADPCFAHAPDYSSITGELYHVKNSDVWTVRYASTDEDDQYGGKVTLSDIGSMEGLESGQMVHVEGRLADPESKELFPKYQVHSIHPVKK